VLWGDAIIPARTAEDVLTLCRQYCERKLEGVFFAPIESLPHREEINKEIVSLLKEADIAVVLLDRDVLEFPGRSDFDLIGIDNFTAGLVLTEHLIALGNRMFRFLARPNYPGTTNLRLAGSREAIARAGLTQAEPLAWFGDPSDTDFIREMLAPALPDAILCSNDQTAAKLIQTLSGMGIRLPQDVGIVGFDDVRYATLLTVPLTTIHQPCAAIGHAAVRAMLGRIQHPDRAAQQILLPFSLIVRAEKARGCRDDSGRAVESRSLHVIATDYRSAGRRRRDTGPSRTPSRRGFRGADGSQGRAAPAAPLAASA
jgi:DNA-binding LacI/PurR family transcriptional regulator